MSSDINYENISSEKKVSTRETHYKIATVGKDTIEAEYIEFEHSWNFKIKTSKWYEKVWDVITTPYYKAKCKLNRAYWEARYGIERMFKGYDSVDTFDTFSRFIDRYTKVIKELRNSHMGYPYDLSEEKWDEVLDEMIYHLYYMDENHVIEELEKDVPDTWIASAKTTGKIIEKHKDEFFELFSKYFYNLWD